MEVVLCVLWEIIFLKKAFLQLPESIEPTGCANRFVVGCEKWIRTKKITWIWVRATTGIDMLSTEMGKAVDGGLEKH